MSDYPKKYLYSKEHEWVDVQEDDVISLGVTDFAQKELGEVVFVELPEVGSVFSQNDEIGTIESVKAVAEVYTPVSGEVVAVNDELNDQPQWVNEHPHDKGWLVKFRLSQPEELDGLMKLADYQSFAEG